MPAVRRIDSAGTHAPRHHSVEPALRRAYCPMTVAALLTLRPSSRHQGMRPFRHAPLSHTASQPELPEPPFLRCGTLVACASDSNLYSVREPRSSYHFCTRLSTEMRYFRCIAGGCVNKKGNAFLTMRFPLRSLQHQLDDLFVRFSHAYFADVAYAADGVFGFGFEDAGVG